MPIILFTASSLLKPLQHLLFKIEQKEQFPLHPREVSIEIVSYIFSGIKSYAEYNVFLSKVILSIIPEHNREIGTCVTQYNALQ